jgi:uncharacterized protein (DUF2384 family)
MAPTSTPEPIIFHLKIANTELTITASTLAELLDGTRLKKMELIGLWSINTRTYDKRREYPGGVTQDELHRLAAALKVPYLDIARLIYQQCEVDPNARKAPGSKPE